MTETIGYLGPHGSFTEMAAHAVFVDKALQAYETIPDCMDAVDEQQIDYAVVPVENAIEGSVNLTIDYLFYEKNLSIVGEVVLPIRQHLMVHPNHEGRWWEVETVYSHPQAIAQSHHFLRSTLTHAETSFMNSTAMAAEWVKDHPDEKAAAIGNSLAAETYGLVIGEHNVHDYQHNDTRFVVISRQAEPLAAGAQTPYVSDKTTLTVTLPHNHSGALHQVLSAFAWRHLNMSKIESRPTKTGLGHYYFIIDLAAQMDDVMIPGVKKELEALGCKVAIVGSYPCYDGGGDLSSASEQTKAGTQVSAHDAN